MPGLFTLHRPATARLLIVPGLHNSDASHWQTWLQGLHRHSQRVEQRDWVTPDLACWSARLTNTLDRSGPRPWIAVAHSFGCLALVHHLASQPATPIHAALLVAAAEPHRFGLTERLPHTRLPVMSTVVASQTDPWMSAASAQRWAGRWGSHWINLGDAGHINSEAGFGPLPLARRWVMVMEQRLARQQYPVRASFSEWQFAT